MWNFRILGFMTLTKFNLEALKGIKGIEAKKGANEFLKQLCSRKSQNTSSSSSTGG